MPLQYINKKGNPVVVAVSNHARKRFHQRWNRLYPKKPLLDTEVDAEIEKSFLNADRVQNLDKHEKKRSKRHGGDTLFFRTNGFTFVVQDCTIITIEISDDGMRQLNKKPSILRYLNA